MNLLMNLWEWLLSLLPASTPQSTAFGIEKPLDTPQKRRAGIAAIIARMNDGPAYINGVVTNPAKGTIIHNISETTADMLAGVIIAASESTGIPVPYGMACLCAESLFDPACENGNFVGSNPEKTPEGFDVGVAQLKLKFLSGFTPDEARAFALDPSKAIPYCFNSMSSRLKLAEAFIVSKTTQMSEEYFNRYYVATGMYNFGQVGFAKLDHTKPLAHCEVVSHYEQTFAQALGEPSVFGITQG